MTGAADSADLEPARRTRSAIDPFAPVTSPDVGEHCAASLSAADITDFFAGTIGSFQGADYQRAFRLTDGRVLWTFQDAFVSGTLVHNVGMVQSGRCFTMLNSGARSWLLGELTSHMQQWQWIFDGTMNTDGTKVHLFVAQMNETGGSYLSRTRPTAVRRVVLDAATLTPIDVVEEAAAQYADLPLGTVDASVIAAAERLGTNDIATLDLRHFTVVRSNVGTLNLLP